MRFTWNPALPLPYESAWGLFSKLLALNYCNPAHIAEAIVKRGLIPPRELNFRDSSWIDIDRFSDMLGVHPHRLRLCFLDQLGFPHITPDDKGGIRVCPLCLANGYHSVFFDLGMVGGCPIHGVKLEKPCATCAKTILRGGLRREVRRQDAKGILGLNASERVYGSPCGHINFDPNRMVRTAVTMTKSEVRELKLWGDRFVRWWISIYGGPNGIPEIVGSLARVSVDDRYDDDLANRIGIAESIGGACPWPLRVKGADRQSVSWTQPADSVSEEKENDVDHTLLFDAYRAVRRLIYRRYIRPHRGCWKTLSNLTWLDTKALSSESVCAVALAYASWRMSIEGFSNVECFKKHRQNPVTWPIRRMRQNVVDVRANLQWWYAYFFAVLEGVETHIAKGNFYIERSNWPAFDVEYCEAISWSFVLLPATGMGDTDVESWWVIFPERRRLIKKTGTRCIGRLKGPDAFLAFDLLDWDWTGRYSESNRPKCLFKIKNTSLLNYTVKSYRHLMV